MFCPTTHLFLPYIVVGHRRVHFGAVGNNHLVALDYIAPIVTSSTFNMAADDDVATKAPESDAKESSMISSEDTPAQKGASMGVRHVAPHS